MISAIAVLAAAIILGCVAIYITREVLKYKREQDKDDEPAPQEAKKEENDEEDEFTPERFLEMLRSGPTDHDRRDFERWKHERADDGLSPDEIDELLAQRDPIVRLF